MPWPRFELAPGFSFFQLDAGHPGSLNCVGGGVVATYNLNRWIGITADVTGCKMQSPGVNMSGDYLNYVAGPRFTYRSASGWDPYVQALWGGVKLSTNTIYPDLRHVDIADVPEIDQPAVYSSYTSQEQTNSWAFKFGAGVNRVMNEAVAIRVIDVADVHVWSRSLNGRYYPNNIAITTGVTLRFGTW